MIIRNNDASTGLRFSQIFLEQVFSAIPRDPSVLPLESYPSSHPQPINSTALPLILPLRFFKPLSQSNVGIESFKRPLLKLVWYHFPYLPPLSHLFFRLRTVI